MWHREVKKQVHQSAANAAKVQAGDANVTGVGVGVSASASTEARAIDIKAGKQKSRE